MKHGDPVNELCRTDAITLAGMVHNNEISCSELLQAHLEQIDRINPRVNAICTLAREQAIGQARELDRLQARGEFLGKLHGLPIAIKDLALTRGIRTTLGSPIYRDFVPNVDALFVQRLQEAGAVIIGKTNTPEFGAGSHTFNEVFGITRNPYDTSRTCGGSSGGAAVALATGMLPLADGSDLAGSLRNPAAWNNVVGFRPSPGRVPDWPSQLPHNPLPVTGPMARTVADTAFMLSVMAGPDPRAPLSQPEPGSDFAVPLQRDFTATRIAWTPDLGRYPVEPAIIDTLEASLTVFADLGCTMEPAHPDLPGADEVFQALRADLYATVGRSDYEQHRESMKETVRWNIEQGLGLSADEISRAWVQQKQIVQSIAAFFQEYDFLILPAVQVTPFPVETEWPRQINGNPMHTYIDWMAICYAITTTLCPCISVPAGFTGDGLPTGLQIVGPAQADLAVLQLAHAFEQATGHGRQTPPLCAGVA